LTPWRDAGKAKRVQCRRAKELRTVGGDLIDGSPERNLNLILDESGERPRLLTAISMLLERLMSKTPKTAILDKHQASFARVLSRHENK